MNLSADKRRHAFTLTEMLVVMAVLGMILTLSTAAIVAATKTRQADARFYERLALQHSLADRFRGDVAAASRLVEMAAGRVVLELPKVGLVVYQVREGAVGRIVTEGKEEREQKFPVPAEGTTVEFAQRDGTIVLRWLTEAAPRSGIRRALEYAAALGGDLQ